jgi:hypothetical protein
MPDDRGQRQGHNGEVGRSEQTASPTPARTGDETLRLLEGIGGRPLQRWLKRCYPGLQPEDLADVWAETLLAAVRAARQGRLHVDQPLWRWLCRVGRARAIDLLRRRGVRLSALEGLQHIAGPAAYGGREASWEVCCRELRDLLATAIAGLPSRQRSVLQAYVEHFPDTGQTEYLRRRVADARGEAVTRAAVKRALQEGRARLRCLLRNHGYAPES